MSPKAITDEKPKEPRKVHVALHKFTREENERFIQLLVSGHSVNALSEILVSEGFPKRPIGSLYAQKAKLRRQGLIAPRNMPSNETRKVSVQFKIYCVSCRDRRDVTDRNAWYYCPFCGKPLIVWDVEVLST